MSVKTAQVYDYLDAHPVSSHEGDFESVLEMLHDTYVESNPIDSGKIKEGFSGFGSSYGSFPERRLTAFSTLFADCAWNMNGWHLPTGSPWGCIC